MATTYLELRPVLLIEVLGPVVPPVDLLHAAPHTVRIVSGDPVVATTLEVEGKQVRAEVLPEREQGQLFSSC